MGIMIIGVGLQQIEIILATDGIVDPAGYFGARKKAAVPLGELPY
jgi:hypothetical protein